MGREGWLMAADAKVQSAARWVRLHGVSLAEPVFPPSLPLASIHWMCTVLRPRPWTRQKPHLHGANGGVCVGCGAKDLICGNTCLQSPQHTREPHRSKSLVLPAPVRFPISSFPWSNSGSAGPLVERGLGRVFSSFNLWGLQLCLSSSGNSVSIRVTTLRELCVCVGRS